MFTHSDHTLDLLVQEVTLSSSRHETISHSFCRCRLEQDFLAWFLNILPILYQNAIFLCHPSLQKYLAVLLEKCPCILEGLMASVTFLLIESQHSFQLCLWLPDGFISDVSAGRVINPRNLPAQRVVTHIHTNTQAFIHLFSSCC